MKTLQHTKYALFYLSVFFLLLSCEKETPEIVEEQELITTVELQFQASGEATPNHPLGSRPDERYNRYIKSE
jgi:hypothetical protein